MNKCSCALIYIFVHSFGSAFFGVGFVDSFVSRTHVAQFSGTNVYISFILAIPVIYISWCLMRSS